DDKAARTSSFRLCGREPRQARRHGRIWKSVFTETKFASPITETEGGLCMGNGGRIAEKQKIWLRKAIVDHGILGVRRATMAASSLLIGRSLKTRRWRWESSASH